MTGAAARRRAHQEIVRLVHRGLDVHDFSRAATRVLSRVVGFDGSCVLVIDPATALPTGEVVENGLPPAALARMAEIEVGEADVTKFSDLARATRPAATLSAATEGHLDRSLRQREVRRPNGLGDELRAALVADLGIWGGLTLLREAGRSHFTSADVAFAATVSSDLAEGIRRGLLLSGLDAREGETQAGLAVLADDNSIERANDAALTWFDELRRGEAPETLPGVAVAVASRARAIATGRTSEEARARVRTPTGRWLVVRASVLGDGHDAPVAVVLEAASAPELAPLLADAYGLTDRERLVTQLVAQGFATGEIANRLHLSPHTVQDHLKSIFDKVGVSSRGGLVARFFFEHYAPRLTRGTPVGHSTAA